VVYDVLIAGGSFAGLAVAVQLRGRRVLLVEPHEIGAVQTSACGTLLAVLQASGTLDSLVQVHDSVVLHLGEATIEYPTPYTFCTFDYRALCQLLLAQADAEVVRASVLRHDGRVVTTTQGEFEARVLVDATGWRAALATNSQRREKAPAGSSFGVETSLPMRADGLHFYYEPSLMGSRVVGWMFPAGATSRIGVGSYRGRSQLNQSLSRLLEARFSNAPDGRPHSWQASGLALMMAPSRARRRALLSLPMLRASQTASRSSWSRAGSLRCAAAPTGTPRRRRKNAKVRQASVIALPRDASEQTMPGSTNHFFRRLHLMQIAAARG